ncbi:hypothetical protein PF008_g23845 [Phytophthora fragariae]|uniref:SCP domain-containing protein n=2 Tax=Phytophthora fragariae TaxID=53985 RepID=A0A6G0QQ93_9STRA|nr:hypothetical protein PF008_g23845 [Phytophthora fragariae]
MDAWMKSSEHRANILGDFNMLGVSYAYNGRGSYQHYWTQDFGKSNRESCSSPGGSTIPSSPGRVPQSTGGVPNNTLGPKKQDQVQSEADPVVQQTIMHVPRAQKTDTLSAKEQEADLGIAVSPVPKTDVYVVHAKTPCPAGERSIEETPVQVDSEKDCDPKF